MADDRMESGEAGTSPVDGSGNLTGASVQGLPVLLTAQDVGNVLQLSKQTVYKLGIPSVQVGAGSLRWCPHDVRQYIAERRQAA